MKAKWILGWGLVVLALFNFSVWRKERLLESGRTVLLKLVPVDPRSLMQGDYMILNYAIFREAENIPERDGRFVLKNDGHGVAQWVGFDDGGPLAEDCFFLKYKRKKGRLSVGAESFFFQEGHGTQYQRAEYGELAVDGSGNSVLVGLRDEDLQRIEPKPPE